MWEQNHLTQYYKTEEHKPGRAHQVPDELIRYCNNITIEEKLQFSL